MEIEIANDCVKGDKRFLRGVACFADRPERPNLARSWTAVVTDGDKPELICPSLGRQPVRIARRLHRAMTIAIAKAIEQE